MSVWVQKMSEIWTLGKCLIIYLAMGLNSCCLTMRMRRCCSTMGTRRYWLLSGLNSFGSTMGPSRYCSTIGLSSPYSTRGMSQYTRQYIQALADWWQGNVSAAERWGIEYASWPCVRVIVVQWKEWIDTSQGLFEFLLFNDKQIDITWQWVQASAT